VWSLVASVSSERRYTHDRENLPNQFPKLASYSKQIRAITKLAVRLGITEPLEETPRNRKEARDLIYQLRGKVRKLEEA